MEVAAPAPGEPMDINTAVQLVMKKALAHDGLARGLHEAARSIERVSSNCKQQAPSSSASSSPLGSSSSSIEVQELEALTVAYDANICWTGKAADAMDQIAMAAALRQPIFVSRHLVQQCHQSLLNRLEPAFPLNQHRAAIATSTCVLYTTSLSVSDGAVFMFTGREGGSIELAFCLPVLTVLLNLPFVPCATGRGPAVHPGRGLQPARLQEAD